MPRPPGPVQMHAKVIFRAIAMWSAAPVKQICDIVCKGRPARSMSAK